MIAYLIEEVFQSTSTVLGGIKSSNRWCRTKLTTWDQLYAAGDMDSATHAATIDATWSVTVTGMGRLSLHCNHGALPTDERSSQQAWFTGKQHPQALKSRTGQHSRGLMPALMGAVAELKGSGAFRGHVGVCR